METLAKESSMPAIKIIETTILSSSFHCNPELAGEESECSTDLSVSCMLTHNMNEEEDMNRCECQVSIKCIITSEDDESTVCSAECVAGVLVGMDSSVFAEDETFNKAVMEEKATEAGFAKARNFIEMISADTPYGKIVIPVSNLADLAE